MAKPSAARAVLCSSCNVQKKPAVGVNQRKLTLSRSTDLDTLRMLRVARMTGLAKLHRSAWRHGEGPVRAVSAGRSYRSQGPVRPRTVGPQIQLV